MSTRSTGRTSVRSIAGIAALATLFAVGSPAVASADPLFGSSTGSGLLDDPVATVTAGIGIAIDYLGGESSNGSSGIQTQRCDASTQSGGAGVTETTHQIGQSGPTSFVLSYDTFSIPDDIQVLYQGAVIADTGYVGDDINEGNGSMTVAVPPGGARSVLVRVTGPGGTDWNYTVYCPS